MADLFDRFTGSASQLVAAHTADSGQAWGPSGVTELLLSGSGSLYSSQTDGSYSTDYWAQSGWTPPNDYDVSVVVGASLPGAAFSAIGPIARASGAEGSQTFYGLLISPGSAHDTITVFFVESIESIPAFETLGSQQILESPIVAGDTFTLRTQGAGSTVTLSVLRNGTQIYQVTDSSAFRITSKGSAGIFINNFTGNTGTDMVRTLWAGAIGGPSETVSPASVTVPLGGGQSFFAGYSLPNEIVDWTASHGSFSPAIGASTTYTAPGSGSTDSATWTSADLPLHTATAPITLYGTPTPTPTPTPSPTPTRRRPRKGPSVRRPVAMRLDFPLTVKSRSQG